MRPRHICAQCSHHGDEDVPAMRFLRYVVGGTYYALWLCADCTAAIPASYLVTRAPDWATGVTEPEVAW